MTRRSIRLVPQVCTCLVWAGRCCRTRSPPALVRQDVA